MFLSNTNLNFNSGSFNTVTTKRSVKYTLLVVVEMEASWQSFIDYMIERGSIDELMIISSETGGLYASSDNKSFYLREYKAMITQEDGNEKEETVNEANNILAFMKGSKPSQGLRINGKKKQQITRSFKDEETGLQIIYSKMPQGNNLIIIIITIFVCYYELVDRPSMYECIYRCYLWHT